MQWDSLNNDNVIGPWTILEAEDVDRRAIMMRGLIKDIGICRRVASMLPPRL